MSDENTMNVVHISALSEKPLKAVTHFDPAKLEEVRERLNVPAVQVLQADFSISRDASLISVRGQLQAELTRLCVASLEQMAERINAAFEVEFLLASEAQLSSQIHEEEISVAEDEPEPLDRDQLDLVEIAVQQLALEMAPYPKKPGASPLLDEVTPQDISPFAALQQMQRDQD